MIDSKCKGYKKKCRPWPDLNQRSPVYKIGAITTKPQGPPIG